MHKILELVKNEKTLKITGAILSMAGMAIEFISGKVKDAQLKNKVKDMIVEELSKNTK